VTTTKPDPHAPITWPTGDGFLLTVYRGKTAPGVKPRHYWRVTSTRGQILTTGGQGYWRRTRRSGRPSGCSRTASGAQHGRLLLLPLRRPPHPRHCVPELAG
jgi:hypothetical protein